MSVPGVIVTGMTGRRMPDSGELLRVVTTAELARAGFTQARVRWLVGSGALTSVGRGLYARASDVQRMTSVQGGATVLRVAAAVAAVGAQAVGSHRDAAIVHGLDLLGRQSTDLVSVTRELGATGSRTSRRGIRLHIAALPAEHRTVRLGAPVTAVARTVIDLARTTAFKEGVAVADSALRGKQATKTDLSAVIAACERWPGITRARQVVEFADARSESAFESISRVVFAQGGLPPPELQVWVGAEGRVIARVDFLWRKYATIAEADGAIKYADPERAKLQLQRDAELREAGFEVVHFTWQDLHINPAQVLRSIKVAFNRSVAINAAAARPR